MIDRELLRQIAGYVQNASNPQLSVTVRLENRLFAMILVLQALSNGIEGLQRFYDDADIATLIAAAQATEPLDEDGTLTKRNIVKYLALIVSLRTWSTTAISGQVTETPRQLLSRQPEKVITP